MAKSKKYHWEIGGALPTIEEHSLVKLNIIEKYLEAYMKHLTIHPFSTTLKFAIIDGFSGGGIYNFKGNEIFGSPLRILETIQRVKTEITLQRQNDNRGLVKFDIPVYCIEKDKKIYDFLIQAINQRNFKNNVAVVNGEFATTYQRIIKELRDKKYNKAIFILDQYGYSDANISTIRNILTSFKNAEIILTFACDSLIDYLSEKNITALSNLGLDMCNIEYLLDTKQEDDRNRNALRAALLNGIIQQVGACFYTPFFIKGRETHRAYWLLHFSNHPIARNEMVKLHYEYYNSFIHYGGSGLDMFGYSTKDIETFNTFLFAEEDKNKSLKCIESQIDEKVAKHSAKTFGELIKSEINHTPATIEVIQESLKEYLLYGDIEIINPKTNKLVKNHKNIKLDHIIKRTKQQRFKF